MCPDVRAISVQEKDDTLASFWLPRWPPEAFELHLFAVLGHSQFDWVVLAETCLGWGLFTPQVERVTSFELLSAVCCFRVCAARLVRSCVKGSCGLRLSHVKNYLFGWYSEKTEEFDPNIIQVSDYYYDLEE